MLMMMTTSLYLVAAFTPLQAPIMRQRVPTNERLQHQSLMLMLVLNSTPTDDDQESNDTPTSSKSADTINHFLKPDFIDAIHQKTGMTKKESESIYKVFVDILTEQLLVAADTDPNRKIKIPKFGTFSIKLRAERNGKDPRSGDPITIAAAKKATFTPAASLKDLLNGKAKSTTTTVAKKNGGKNDDDDDDEDDNE